MIPETDTHAPATIVRKTSFGSDLLNQLEIKGGLLVLKASGKTPTFDLPDGTSVTVMGYFHAIHIMDQAAMMRAWAS